MDMYKTKSIRKGVKIVLQALSYSYHIEHKLNLTESLSKLYEERMPFKIRKDDLWN